MGRCVIFCAGGFEKLALPIEEDDYILAADGGLAHLQKLGLATQFIAITHRRGTMEEADTLYGVTMQERGVSKLLELRASEVEQKLGLKLEDDSKE